MFTDTMIVYPTAPFSLDLSAKIFSGGDERVRSYNEGVFRQVIRVHGQLVLLCISSKGTIDDPQLKVDLRSETGLTGPDRERAKKIVARLFNLDLDPTPFYEAVENDETMRKVTQILRGLRSPSTQTVFEALVDSITEQQISLIVATSIERRIIKKFGETLTADGEAFYAYPTPQALSLALIADLRSCGLSQRKAGYIKELSELEASGKLDLEKLKASDDTQGIIARLDSIKGIGPWTAELTVIRSMQKWDALPADDVGLRRVIAHYYCGGNKITSEQARKIAEAWGSWRGLAAYYLIIAELTGVEV
jgi:DNA-3-methyladenine glycosylase II